MKRVTKKILAVLLVMVMVFGVIPFRATAATANELATQIRGVGFDATVSENVVTVGGSATLARTLALNINSGVRVVWGADITSAINAYLFDISGGGEFEIRNATISSTGARTSGAIRVSGAATVTVGQGGTVLAERIGNPMLITAGGVTVNVNSGGMVRSLASNSNAAIQINSGVQPVAINVNGGSIISDTNGYAIGDGAGTDPTGNITTVNVTGGVVTAASNSAIRMTGMNSTATVSGGVVSNAAGNNLNPVIEMVGDMGGIADSSITAPNVTVTGTGVVECTSTSGYTIQTRGNVLVTGNAQVTAINGRAINLVGLNSIATVSGNALLQGSGPNVISTATTDALIPSVANARVVIEGGTVRNTGSGDHSAINVTGANSSVTVSGGVVTTSGTGNTVNAGTTATNATVNVSGGQVSATGSGNAIYVSGTGTRTAVNVSDGQVTATSGRAINIRSANATLGLTGGFVFAYGSTFDEVIHATNVTGPANLAGLDNVVVCAWDISSDTSRQHFQGSYRALQLWTGDLGTTIFWHNHPGLGGGINYTRGTTAGFFPLPVTITNNHGLIFDSDTGNMYRDVNGDGIIGEDDDQFFTGSFALAGEPAAWEGSRGRLVLNSFSWTTEVPTSLTIIGNVPTTIVSNSDSVFESTYAGSPGVISKGIRVRDGAEITIAGEAELTAIGSGNGGVGLNIGAGTLNIGSGTFTARGQRQAIDWEGGGSGTAGKAGPVGTHYTWKWSLNFEGYGDRRGDSADGGNWNAGISDEAAFEFFSTDKYVRLRALTPVSFSAEQVGGISGVADSIAILLTFSTNVESGDLSIDNLTVRNATGIVAPGTLTGSNNTWTLALDRVDAEGVISIEISDFGAYHISPRVIDDIAVYKASLFNLTVNATEGGSTSGDVTGEYFAGAPISVSAEPDPLFHFIGWTIDGADLRDGAMAKPATFNMPANDVILTANFALNPMAHTLNIFKDPGGAVVGTPVGAYFEGDHIDVTAEPNPGFHFTGWTRIVGEVEVTDFDMADDHLDFSMPDETVTLRAHFEPKDYILTVITRGSGTVTDEPGGPHHTGDPITAVAVPESGYHFVGWTIDGATLTDGAMAKPATFNMPANDVTLTANFEANPREEAPPHYTLNVVVNGGGRVAGTHSGAYVAGYSVSVTAEPNPGFHFTGWTINGATLTDGAMANPATTFDMPANVVTLTANFAPNDYTLTVIVGGGGSVPDNPGGPHPVGDHIIASPEPDPGFHFVGWTIDGAVITGGDLIKPARFDMPANDVTLTAHFERNPMAHTLNVFGSPGGTTGGTPSGAYFEGEPISITAVPLPGYYFTHWVMIVDGEVVADFDTSVSPLDFLMPNHNVTVTAYFERIYDPPADIPDDTPDDDTPHYRPEDRVPPVRDDERSPQTGDNRNIMLPIIMLSAGVVMIGVAPIIAVLKKRR